jgi:hypothetical protein
VSGKSLVVLRQTAGGSLASLSKSLQFDPGAAGSALFSGNDVVMQVSASSGWQSVTVPGIKPPPSRTAQVQFVDALTGVVSPSDDVAMTWDDAMLKVRFKVPDEVNGAGNNPPKHLAYVVVRPLA